MPFSSYSELKAEIAEHLDRDDLDSQIESFIRLAEARHAREIRIREMLTRVQADLDDRYADLPTNFLEMVTLRLLTSPVTALQEISQHEMNRRRQGSTGKPAYFCVQQEIEFDRGPDGTYTMEMIYHRQLDALSNSNTSNALLERAPDAYLYGALLAAEPFLVNDERIQTWSALYTSARDTINALDRKRGGPLVARVQGATP